MVSTCGKIEDIVEGMKEEELIGKLLAVDMDDENEMYEIVKKKFNVRNIGVFYEKGIKKY